MTSQLDLQLQLQLCATPKHGATSFRIISGILACFGVQTLTSAWTTAFEPRVDGAPTLLRTCDFVLDAILYLVQSNVDASKWIILKGLWQVLFLGVRLGFGLTLTEYNYASTIKFGLTFRSGLLVQFGTSRHMCKSGLRYQYNTHTE